MEKSKNIIKINGASGVAAHARSAVMAFVTAIALAGAMTAAAAQAPQKAPRMIPHFEVDPSWPKLPDKWVWGQVSSVSIDSQGHAWILQRPSPG